MVKKIFVFLFVVIISIMLTFPNQVIVHARQILIIAHRGASAHAPEHTMEAYQLANKLGADFIEIDLQMSHDNVLVAMHDDKVDRTTDGKGLVSSYTLDELKDLDAGSWFNKKYPEKAKDSYAGAKIPTLDEIFQHFGHRVNYYLETKKSEQNKGMEEKLMQLLEKYKFTQPSLPIDTGQVIIQSFDKESLMNFHKKYPALPLVQLSQSSRFSDEELEDIKKYAVGIGMNYRDLNKDLVDKIKSKDLFIHPYTVNHVKDFQLLKKWGVDGVATDEITF